MSLEDELAKVNEEYAKMQLDTHLHVSTSSSNQYTRDRNGDQVTTSGRWVLVGDVVAILLETYQQAIEIGWETKALDALATRIRQAAEW